MRALLVAAVLGLTFTTLGATAVRAATAAAYSGPKKSVAVDVVGGAETLGSTTNEALVAMFSEALVNDGRFIVVERTALGLLQGEQQLTTQSGVTAETGARAGQLLGASALIRATVTKFQANAGGSSLQVSGMPALGRFAPGGGLSAQSALVEIALRLINTSTGEVIATAKASGKASSRKADLGIVDTRTGANLGGSAFRSSPLGKATEAAIAASVEKIALGMENVPWSAQVIEVSGGQAYVGIGADQNIGPGAILHVYRKTKELTDPTTGALLEVLMDEVAAIRIETVREKVSTATVLSGGALLRGDVVRLK